MGARLYCCAERTCLCVTLCAHVCVPCPYMQESALVLALESKLVSMECTLQSLSTASQQHATDLQHGLAAATTQLQQDTAAQLQDVLARTAETERVMRDMQAAQDALTHKVQAMQQGAEEVSKALTVVGDQLQKLVSKYAG